MMKGITYRRHLRGDLRTILNRYQTLTTGLSLLVLTGCTTYGVIDNTPITKIDLDAGYSWRALVKNHHSNDITVVLSFSGGGTRAAALSYGVLQGLRDTTIEVNGKPVRLLDEVDYISSVSGGSFTAAYYGLYGDRIFEDYESDFLLRDVESHLMWGVVNPLEWFSAGGRTEMAVRYYNEHVFHDATFADMNNNEERPLILISASDLGHGMRFSFIQDYFNLICSDLSSFPVAKAVAASSAVPVVFLPVVLENHSDCDTSQLPWAAVRKRADTDPLMEEMISNVDSLLDKKQRRYVHLVDGGITDNLGLRALYELVAMSGGAQEALRKHHKKPPSHVVIISVNASTNPPPAMDQSNVEPSIGDTVSAMSDVQMHRYNTATLELMERSLVEWSAAMSTPEHTVQSYFINVGVRSIDTEKQRLFFNMIPTSLALSKEQVDHLANSGRNILQNDPDYQKLITELGGSIDTH